MGGGGVGVTVLPREECSVSRPSPGGLGPGLKKGWI